MIESIITSIIVGIIIVFVGMGVAYKSRRLFFKAVREEFDISGNIDKKVEEFKGFVNEKIEEAFEEAQGFVDEQKKEFVEQALPKVLELGTAAIAAAIKTDRMSQLGARGAEVKGEKRALKAAAEGVAINMIEDKVPGMGASIWGMVPDEIKKMAVENPQMIVGIIDKFKGAGGGQGGFGAAQGGGSGIPSY